MSSKARVFFIAFCLIVCFFAATATAFGISSSSRVEITEDGQVVDSLSYNNVLTQAVYTPKENVANYNTDTTYCCAALVKRFYSSVHKVTVYGLLSPSSVPVVTSGSFYEVSSPKAGDIVRFSNYTHWALVKKIDAAGNITLLEQNVWSGDYALVGRVIDKSEISSGAYTYFRYSTKDIDNSGSDNNVHTHAYKKKFAEGHPHQYYKACSCGDYYHLDEYATSIKCKSCYNQRYGSLAASASASPNTATVKVNGKAVKFDAYNIGGNNFFKLRDLAYTINGTAKKFSVDWDNNLKAIAMTGGSSYKANGSEMAAQGTKNVTADITNASLYFNKAQIYPLTYNIQNNNYVKLQDLAMALDINVGYDSANKIITIDTSKGY
ncbi:MAG: hypothetical protein ACOX7J_00005 [Bacillota bacterium]|jgi:hypothetical protein